MNPFPNCIKRPALLPPNHRIAGGVVTGYGECRHPTVLATLNALSFYWIRVRTISFCSQSALLICESKKDAARAAALLLELFPQVIFSAKSGVYENTQHGWVEIGFHESVWYE